VAGYFEAYEHEVTIQTLGIEFAAIVYFVQDQNFSRNFLGRLGWLDRLRVGIIDYANGPLQRDSCERRLVQQIGGYAFELKKTAPGLEFPYGQRWLRANFWAISFFASAKPGGPAPLRAVDRLKPVPPCECEILTD
jgi:hypothetical protein